MYKLPDTLTSEVLKNGWLWRMLDVAWLLLLVLYVLAGTHLVPFHGDESTIIAMSEDYAYIFHDNRLDLVRYSDPPLIPAEQQPRLITGSLIKYLIGLSWDLNGYSASDLNEQWHWEFDWDWNVSNGHMPDDTLLMLARWPSAIMLAMSVIVLFAVGYLLGGRGVAYVASLYYALNPVVLLNGRRAMFEGGLLLFTCLIVLTALLYARLPRLWKVILLGLSFGLALAMKHTAVITIVAVGAAIFANTWIRQRQDVKRVTAHLMMAGLVGLAVTYLLHPVWWGNPLVRLPQIVQARSELLAGQVGAFGGYGGALDRITGFVRQTFTGKPQFYEVSEWSDYIADQIARYQESPWAGMNFGGSTTVGVVVMVFTITGFWVVLRRRIAPESTRWIIGMWSVVTLASVALLTPLEWQRYYLSAFPVIALLLAVGVKVVASDVWSGVQSRSERLTQNEQ